MVLQVLGALVFIISSFRRQYMHDDIDYALALACLAAREYGVKGVIIKI